MIIRKANLSDAKSIAKIHYESRELELSRTLGRILHESSLKEFERYWKLHFMNLKDETLVCEEANNIIGFITYINGWKDKGSEKILVGVISAIYISPVQLQKGYGMTLIKEAMSKMKDKGTEEVFVWVIDNNNPAIRFYEKVGFAKESVTRVKNHNEAQVIECRYRLFLSQELLNKIMLL
ncbi:MAG: GNAT family N-acetyltransferase [Bacteroidales bacterium]|nr:GNAT family N-acetyltransferase [Bacteroidales bacterium]